MFLAHAEGLREELTRFQNDKRFGESFAVRMWMQGASDHLAELQVEHAPEHLQHRLQRLVDGCWRCRLGEDQWSREEAVSAITEAKELLRLIDEHHGVPTTKATWS